MKIVFSGGHLTPALALLPLLTKKHNLLFIGRKYAFEGDSAVSFEYKTISALDIPFKTITTGRLQRRFTRHTIPSLFKFPIGFIQSLGILKEFKPDIVLSFGGYMALPVALAAVVLGIPIITHEQTSTVGLANRIIAFFAKKICISFPESARFFSASKTILTGNPIRGELFHAPSRSPFPEIKTVGKLPIVYVTGGSGGAHSINILVEATLDELLKKAVVIHQTGDANSFKDFEVLSEKATERYIVRKHVNTAELAWIYANASFLVGRSGANTVSEILTFGIPSLFIPLPWAGSSEQLANAKLVSRVGLGKIMHQEELTASSFAKAILDMLKHNKEYKKHTQKASQFVLANAADNIVGVLENAT